MNENKKKVLEDFIMLRHENVIFVDMLAHEAYIEPIKTEPKLKRPKPAPKKKPTIITEK